MIVAKEMIQNHLMGYTFVQKLISKYHKTGINSDDGKIDKAYGFYTDNCDVVGKDILEIGPGHTIDMLKRARQDGCSSASAVDIAPYITPATAIEHNVNYKLYDGKTIPFDDNSFDIVWSYDVFEHIRYPEITIKEVNRVLKPDGVNISLIDLADHFSFGMGKPEQTFNCLKYSKKTWEAMTWNRSNYVNRLRYGDWVSLFKDNGFEITSVEGVTNKTIEKLYDDRKIDYLAKYNRTDAITSAISIVAKKMN